MYHKTSYNDDFNDLLMYLRGKYGNEMFEIEGIGRSQTDMATFGKTFFKTKTSISDTSVDANSNIDDRNISIYVSESAKPFHKLNSYYLLWDRLKKENGLLEANRLVEMALNGDLYIHDLWLVSSPYCYNFSCIDIMFSGLPMVTKIKTNPPKHLYAFKSILEQFIAYASNQLLGACGIADVLICMSYYVEKILDTKSDAGFNFISEDDCWNYVRENLISLIYTLNQPFRGGIQSPFTNVSVYDSYFLDKFCSEYTFPDGTNPRKETVQKIQEIYLGVMNSEMRRTPITFPVTTAAFSVDDERNIQDKEFLNLIVKENMEFAFINIYTGKTSTLSSCCFEGDELIEVINKSTGVSEKLPMSEFVNKCLKPDEIEKHIEPDYQIMSYNPEKGVSELSDIVGVLRRDNEFSELISIEVGDNAIKVTPDHIFTVKDTRDNSLKEIIAANLDKRYHLIPIED